MAAGQWFLSVAGSVEKVPLMPQGRTNSLRLFRVFGVDVYLHWTWLLVAIWQIAYRPRTYSSFAWSVIEYLALFLIVLLHEFGHALACRQVGGKADRILLWPLGGVAYISPPERPGALLWSVAAGPLVNVVLFIVCFGLTLLGSVLYHVPFQIKPQPDWFQFLFNLSVINLLLLVFNLLPIYPLDGGQILRALLWFPLGRARSLFAVAVAGFAGVAMLAVYALYEQSFWMGFLTLFILLRCFAALKVAQRLTATEQLPRRTDFACPSCGTAPPAGAIWRCPQCRAAFDCFANDGICPQCQARDESVQCFNCKTVHPLVAWRSPPPPLPAGNSIS